MRRLFVVAFLLLPCCVKHDTTMRGNAELSKLGEEDKQGLLTPIQEKAGLQAAVGFMQQIDRENRGTEKAAATTAEAIASVPKTTQEK
jgi:hypothetical protein